MPKWLKIVLLVGGLTFLSFFAMCGACAYASYDLGKDVVEQAPQMIAEGERDALDTDQAGCLELALDRGVACEKMGPLDAGKPRNSKAFPALTGLRASSRLRLCAALGLFRRRAVYHGGWKGQRIRAADPSRPLLLVLKYGRPTASAWDRPS